jgi:hypothetical protein
MSNYSTNGNYTIDEIEAMLGNLNIDLREFSMSDIIRLSRKTSEEFTKELENYERDRLVNVSKELADMDFNNFVEGETYA